MVRTKHARAAESSSAKLTRPKTSRRGGFHPPNTAEHGRVRIKTVIRVATFRLDADRDQWMLLNERIRQYANYCNLFMQAMSAETRGWTAPKKLLKGIKAKNLMALVRQQTSPLSSYCYVAAETEVKQHFKRDIRKILPGAPLPQFRERNGLGLASFTKNKPVRSVLPGVELSRDEETGQVSALLKLSEGRNYITCPIFKRNYRDARNWWVLEAILKGKLEILDAKISLAPRRGLTLLRIAYNHPIKITPVKKRTATLALTEMNDDVRLLVRPEHGRPLDLTGDITTFRSKKEQWSAIRRRMGMQLGSRKGAARAKRRKFAALSVEDYTRTHFRQLASKVIKWCVAQGCGKLRIIETGGGDWPAHMFKQFLIQAGETSNIDVAEVDELADKANEAVQRALDKEANKERRRNVQLQEAIVTFNDALPQDLTNALETLLSKGIIPTTVLSNILEKVQND
jgi:hypothetical protein